MKNFIPLTLLALLISCGGNSSRQISPINSKIVTNVIEYVNSPAWRSSGYSRLTDIQTPIKLVFAGDNTVCPVMTVEMQPTRIGDVYHCRERWRMKQ